MARNRRVFSSPSPAGSVSSGRPAVAGRDKSGGGIAIVFCDGECVTRRRKSFSKRLIEIGEGRRCGLGVRRTNPIHVMARNSGPPSCDRSARRHREESSPRLRLPGQFHLGGLLLRAVTNRGAVLRWCFVAASVHLAAARVFQNALLRSVRADAAVWECVAPSHPCHGPQQRATQLRPIGASPSRRVFSSPSPGGSISSGRPAVAGRDKSGGGVAMALCGRARAEGKRRSTVSAPVWLPAGVPYGVIFHTVPRLSVPPISVVPYRAPFLSRVTRPCG
jgi:hypothetical protein